MQLFSFAIIVFIFYYIQITTQRSSIYILLYLDYYLGITIIFTLCGIIYILLYLDYYIAAVQQFMIRNTYLYSTIFRLLHIATNVTDDPTQKFIFYYIQITTKSYIAFSNTIYMNLYSTIFRLLLALQILTSCRHFYLYSTIFRLLLKFFVLLNAVAFDLYSTIFKLLPSLCNYPLTSHTYLYSTIFKLLQVHIYMAIFQCLSAYICRPIHFLLNFQIKI